MILLYDIFNFYIYNLNSLSNGHCNDFNFIIFTVGIHIKILIAISITKYMYLVKLLLYLKMLNYFVISVLFEALSLIFKLYKKSRLEIYISKHSIINNIRYFYKVYSYLLQNTNTYHGTNSQDFCSPELFHGK